MDIIEKDIRKYYKEKSALFRIILSRNRAMKAQFIMRMMDTICKNRLVRKIGYHLATTMWLKNGIEIASLKNIGGGLLLIHPYNITINAEAVIGEDFTIFKGATIGSIRSGRNAGVPSIGDRVTVCANAFICGNCRIGNDVLIAANSFVNFDVPDNSVVIGSPGIIHKKVNPSADYL